MGIHGICGLTVCAATVVPLPENVPAYLVLNYKTPADGIMDSKSKSVSFKSDTQPDTKSTQKCESRCLELSKCKGYAYGYTESWKPLVLRRLHTTHSSPNIPGSLYFEMLLIYIFLPKKQLDLICPQEAHTRRCTENINENMKASF